MILSIPQIMCVPNLPSKENKPGNNVFKVEHAHDNHCMQGQGKIHKIEWKFNNNYGQQFQKNICFHEKNQCIFMKALLLTRIKTRANKLDHPCFCSVRPIFCDWNSKIVDCQRNNPIAGINLYCNAIMILFFKTEMVNIPKHQFLWKS